MFEHNTEELIESDEYGEADFDAEVIYPDVDNLFTLKTSTLNMCTQSVQLKVVLINKSPMEVQAHYKNTCHLQQYLCTANHLVRAKCVHESHQKPCNSLKFAQIQKC